MDTLDARLSSELQAAYDAMGGAIRKKEIAAFMQMLAPDFVRKEEEGRIVTRAQWEAHRIAEFDRVESYGPVTLEIETVTATGETAVACVRQLLLRTWSKGDPERFVESRSRDTWVCTLAGWRLQCQEVLGYPVFGSIQRELPVIESPTLAGVVEQIKAENRDALTRFWEQMDGQTPLIEPVVDDPTHRWVTFLWRGDATVRDVELEGLLTRRPKPLARLAETDLWFRTERLPVDTRLLYGLAVTQTMMRPADGDQPARIVTAVARRRDPLNPRLFDGSSVLELPEAPPQPWAERQTGVREGELSDQKIASKILNEERALTIYTPPGYDPNGEPCSLLVLFDGEGAKSAPAVLDNLISRGEIPPTVAALVHCQNTRARDLACSDPFAEFLATELVPWTRDHYRVSADPRRTIVSGLSLGGLMAGYCGLQYPEVFGNVLSQSGSFWYSPEWPEITESPATDGGWLLRQFATRERLPLRFYVEIGWFEGPLILAYNRGLRAVLEAKGYPLTYTEFHGGHDYLTWRGSLADGLIALASSRKIPDS